MVPLGPDIDGEAAYDSSGYSVSLSEDGSRLAIGASGNDGDDAVTSMLEGHVRVYSFGYNKGMVPTRSRH